MVQCVAFYVGRRREHMLARDTRWWGMSMMKEGSRGREERSVHDGGGVSW